MANLLQKISWNENLYQKPDISGYAIEKGNDNYISHFGIGHEAWNFNKNELIDLVDLRNQYIDIVKDINNKKFNEIFGLEVESKYLNKNDLNEYLKNIIKGFK